MKVVCYDAVYGLEGGRGVAYRVGDRLQGVLFPPYVEDYVPADAAVRAYDVMVEAMDLEELGIEWNPGKVGCPANIRLSRI